MIASSLSFITRDPETHVILSRGEALGILFDGLAGILSTVAAAVVVVVILWRKWGHGWSNWEALLVSIAALFVAEIFLGVGHAMSLKYVIVSRVDTGMYCIVQGVLRQFGGVSVALVTLTIAVQTFLTIWRLKFLDRNISAVILGVEFIFIILWVTIGNGTNNHPKKEYYTVPTPYWCWIGKDFKAERLAGEYVWFWLTLLVSLASYIPLFLLHHGVIKSGTSWYSPAAQPFLTVRDNRGQQVLQSQRIGVLWYTIFYPTVYCVVILPLSIVRWINFTAEAKTGHSHHWPAATFIVVSLFALSGFLNAILYVLTRRRFFHSEPKVEPEAPPIRQPSTYEGSAQKHNIVLMKSYDSTV